jgi:hypothetical protein
LGQLFGLFRIRNYQSVQVARATDLELGLRRALANFHKLGIGTSSLLQKVANVCNLFRHDYCISIDDNGKEK